MYMDCYSSCIIKQNDANAWWNNMQILSSQSSIWLNFDKGVDFCLFEFFAIYITVHVHEFFVFCFHWQGLFQKAEALYQMGDFEMALVFYHRGNKLRPELQEFRLGIQKAQEAIDNSIGSKGIFVC